MYNGGKILIGLIIFIVLAAFPIWYAVGTGQSAEGPEIEKSRSTTDAEFRDSLGIVHNNCMLDSIEMRAVHMDLLNKWRNDVVRENDRYYKPVHLSENNIEFEKSLTKTCLMCHVNKDKHCDKCHDYLGVKPYCWDCHVDPKEVK